MVVRGFGWAAGLAVGKVGELVGSARASWRAAGLGFAARATRVLAEEQVLDREAVVAVFARRGHRPDVIAGEHRAVYRSLARLAMTYTRLQYLGGFFAIVTVLALWLGVRTRFGIPFGTVSTVLAAYGGFLIVGDGRGVPPRGHQAVRMVLWVWLVVAPLSALGELSAGRTLFDRTLDLFSRIAKK